MNKKRLIHLHIGMNKTGSTAIQNCLDGYDDGTTHYAKLGSPNHSIALTTIFCDEPWLYHIHRNAGRTREDVNALASHWQCRLRQELEGCDRQLILSGEDLTKWELHEVIRLKEYLTPYARRIKVFAYVREPISFSSSAFQQRIQSGLARFDVPLPEYRKRFEKFVESFGRNDIEFVKFGRQSLYKGCVVKDFCRRIELDSSNLSIRTRNQSYSAEVVALLLVWNRSIRRSSGEPRLQQARRQMMELLNSKFSGCFRFSPDLVREYINQDDIDWMETQAGFSLCSEEPQSMHGYKVTSEADLETLAKQARPALVDLIERRGIYSASSIDSVDTLLHTLYSAILERRTPPWYNRLYRVARASLINVYR